MGAHNVLRIIAMIIFGFLFFLGIGCFATSYFFSVSLLSDSMADALSNTFVNAMPSMVESKGFKLGTTDLEANDSLLIAMKPVMKRNIILMFDYIKGNADNIPLEMDKEELKSLLKNLKLKGMPPDFNMASIPDTELNSMLTSINTGLKQQGADLEKQLQPLRKMYNYTNTLFWISVGVLILLVGLTILINFSLYKSLFWLALFFIINPLILMIVGLIGYSWVDAIIAKSAPETENVGKVVLDFISMMVFKYIMIYVIFLIVGVLFLVAFIIWRTKRKNLEKK